MMKNRKNKQKEENKNPYHKSYGLFGNIVYILRNMIATDRSFLFLIPLGVVCAPFMQYLWTFISKFVIDAVMGQGDWRRLLIIVAVCCAVQMAATMLNTYYGQNTWWRYIYTRLRMIQEKNLKVMRMDYEYLEDSDVMDCYQKAGNATNNNNDGIEGMMRTISNSLNVVAVTIVGLAIMGSLNLWVVVFIVVMSAINWAFVNHTNKKTKEKVWDPMAIWWRKRNYMQETTTDFRAAKDIRMFGLKTWLLDKYQDLHRERFETQKLNEGLWLRVKLLKTATWMLSQGIVYAYLVYEAVHGRVSLGSFTMYTASVATFSNYVNQLFVELSFLLAKSREVDDFRSFLDLEARDEEAGGIPVPEMAEYQFVFKNVSFRYPKAEKYALKDMNLTVKAGERLAVVGLNGAGKSTFIKLLLRLYEPTEGEILLNGVNVREYNKHSYYRIFAPVFQNVELFAFPLKENVSMQAPEQTKEARAEQCLKDAGLGDKLKELPQGVHTEILKVIHDEGVDLSGGEIQKLALARALYKDAPVVVLDEPTAALDALAENRLYEDFDKLIGGKTAVYISHRLSSTRFCDQVALFADGTLKEYGTHESLMEQNGEYAKMFRIQAQYYTEGKEGEADA